MSLNVITINAIAIQGMTKNSLSQSRTTSTARFAESPCERCIQVFPVLSSKVQDSIQQIRRIRNAGLTSTYANVLGGYGTLTARALQGLRASRRRVARSVATVIGISLSIVPSPISQGSIGPIHTLRELADIQLTEKQEACHNEIVYRESRFKSDAVNGSHNGYYQGRTTYLIDKPDDVQFYWYWSYVSHRYGVVDDMPNYCLALNHLITKGWQ